MSTCLSMVTASSSSQCRSCQRRPAGCMSKSAPQGSSAGRSQRKWCQGLWIGLCWTVLDDHCSSWMRSSIVMRSSAVCCGVQCNASGNRQQQLPPSKRSAIRPPTRTGTAGKVMLQEHLCLSLYFVDMLWYALLQAWSSCWPDRCCFGVHSAAASWRAGSALCIDSHAAQHPAANL